MSDNLFSSREQMLSQGAQSAYQAGFDENLRKTQEAKVKADKASELIKGITEPLGSVLVGKPFEKAITKGVRTVTGKAGKLVSDNLMKTLKSAANGDLSSFGKNLSSKTTQSIKDLLNDNVPSDIKKGFNKLSSKAQETINKAREKIGKKAIGNDDAPQPRAVEPDIKPTELKPVSDVKPTNIKETEPDMSEADLDTWLNGAKKSAGSAAAESYQGAFEDVHGLRLGQGVPRDSREPLKKFDRDLDEREYEADEGNAAEDNFRTAIERNAEQLADEKPADTDKTNTDSSEQPDLQDDGDPNSGASGNAEDTDKIPGEDESEKGDAPKITEDTDIVPEATGGLEDAADVLGAAAGAEGGLDIFADIAAGIAGLGTILFGNEQKSTPQAIDRTQIVSSGVQFGV